MHGLRSLRFKSCQRAGRSGERSVIVINNDSPFIHRQLAQRVSLIGAGDSQLSNVTYAAREARDERNVHLFMGIEADRARAYVCFERRFRVWKCTWDKYDAGVFHEAHQPMWSIGFAWVSRAHRRKAGFGEQPRRLAIFSVSEIPSGGTRLLLKTVKRRRGQCARQASSSPNRFGKHYDRHKTPLAQANAQEALTV
jgi:hypothetical protein